MDREIAALVREQRLAEAARLASERGDARTASELFERACDWRSAATEALRAGDGRRAMDLAVHAGDDSLAERAASLLDPDPAVAARAALDLAARGAHRWAARLFEGAGRTADAATCWQRAGDSTRAARLWERAGDRLRAARVLESELRSNPEAHASAVALGALLARSGQDEAAVRALQRVPPPAPERADALALLIGPLERLGWSSAAREAAGELASLGRPTTAPGGAASPSPPPPIGGALLFGRYRPTREVASSASARLLECVDVVRGDTVAVKLFAPCSPQGSGRDALARFAREARALAALDHPSVVPLRDFFAEGPATVLGWMAGGNLEQMLSSGPILPARAAEIAASVLRALGDAHRLGIVHRDVKPANILFDSAGAARLADFGAAHLGDVSSTATAGIFGSRGYMSPEQREGRPASAQSDIFGVGVVLQEMLTGQRDAPDRPQAARRPSQVHPDLDARHDALVAHLTAHEPAARPASAVEAAALLRALPWSARPVSGPVALTEHPAPDPGGHRIERGPDGGERDAWTGRAIQRVALSAGSLERARAFATADHPTLQAVLRTDREGATIWFARAQGRPLAGALDTRQHAALLQAVAALHAAGGAHGRIDAQHLWLDDTGSVTLLFDPEGADDALAARAADLAALAHLAPPPG